MKNLIRSLFVLSFLAFGDYNAPAQNQFGNTNIVWTGDLAIPCDLPPLIFEGHNAAGMTAFDPHNPGILPVFDMVSVSTPLGVLPVYHSDLQDGDHYKMIFCCNGQRLLVRVRYDLNYLGSGGTQIPNGATLTIHVQIRPGDCP
jgi:hypothetical protein